VAVGDFAPTLLRLSVVATSELSRAVSYHKAHVGMGRIPWVKVSTLVDSLHFRRDP